MKLITFLTTGQPTTNPRLVKEVETLVSLGYGVRVLYCFYQDWAEQFDADVIASNPEIYIQCGGNPAHSKYSYFATRIRQKICTKLASHFNGLGLAEHALARAHTELLRLAINLKSDLYIAHNLGALPAAVLAAKKNGSKVGYDAEDLSSGFSAANSRDSMLNSYIEHKYFKSIDYFTASSDLIASAYQKEHPHLKPIIILNAFKKNVYQRTESENFKSNRIIKLFWFSQTLGKNRGLENLFEALKTINTEQLELHLLGKLIDMDFKNLIGKQQHLKIFTYKPISANQITRFAQQFDIGLALETAYCLNNNLALSNKIFTYIQSGLAVIASDTAGQESFLKQYPSLGLLFKKNDAQSLAQCLVQLISKVDLLDEIKQGNYYLGQTQLNWELESEKFISVVTKTLNA